MIEIDFPKANAYPRKSSWFLF